MSKLRADSIVRTDIRALSPYPVANAHGMVKLDAMENPYRLVDALTVEQRADLAARLLAADTNRYPDPGGAALRAQLRATMRVPAECELMLGNGSDELIAIVASACARPGAKLMSPWPSFVMYRLSAQLAGMAFVPIDLVLANGQFVLDDEQLLTAMRVHRPAVVILSYPNNPTGTLFPDSTIEAVLAEAPGLVVIDEAYQAFAEASWMPRLRDYPNLIVMRTLSKSGLAGLRLGYMAGHPDWLSEFDKVRPPYNVNALTQTYAQFALEHMTVLDEQAALLRAERVRLANALALLMGVTVYPSAANFLLLRVPGASLVFERLKSRKVLVKYMGTAHPLLHDCLRVTVSTPHENALFLAALTASLAP